MSNLRYRLAGMTVMLIAFYAAAHVLMPTDARLTVGVAELGSLGASARLPKSGPLAF
jgi:hypothetical protein